MRPGFFVTEHEINHLQYQRGQKKGIGLRGSSYG
jgi:hypothetical protein